MVLLAVVLMPLRAKAQLTEPDSVTVSLVTYYPGSEIYELFGHTEVRVTDSNGLDAYFNYGVFDFNAPNFVFRFVSGKTDYMCVGIPGNRYVGHFTPGRKAVEQVLNLTPDEAQEVRRRLMRNIMPDSATYRYKYVSDNCATRPRDIIEAVLGSKLRWPADSVKSTCRQVMAHYNRNYPWEQFGIDIALGCGLDTVLTARQRMFVPVLLMKAAEGATIDRNGHQEPLVKDAQVVNPGSDDGLALPPTAWPLTPMAVSLLLMAVAAGFSYRDIRHHRSTRWLDVTLWTVAAVAGGLVWFLIFISTHEATSPNVNGLWLHPLYALPAVAVWFKGSRRLMTGAFIAMIAAIAVAAACFATGVQAANAAFWPLMATLALRAAVNLAVARSAANQQETTKTTKK